MRTLELGLASDLRNTRSACLRPRRSQLGTQLKACLASSPGRLRRCVSWRMLATPPPRATQLTSYDEVSLLRLPRRGYYCTERGRYYSDARRAIFVLIFNEKITQSFYPSLAVITAVESSHVTPPSLSRRLRRPMLRLKPRMTGGTTALTASVRRKPPLPSQHCRAVEQVRLRRAPDQGKPTRTSCRKSGK
jgi:hypothetical protein